MKVSDFSVWSGTAYAWLKAQESIATCNYAEAIVHLNTAPCSNLKFVYFLYAFLVFLKC